MEYPALWIDGVPKPKGSWTPLKTRNGTIKLRHASNATAKWCKSAAEQVKAIWSFAVLEGPVSVILLFKLPKLATVKREEPIGAYEGDLDKLARGVLDAMSGAVFVDDRQVIALHATKVYGYPNGVHISVRSL